LVVQLVANYAFQVTSAVTSVNGGVKYNYTGRQRLKRDGTRAETRFHVSEKRTSPFESAGVSA
jgi:hypothetical protein